MKILAWEIVAAMAMGILIAWLAKDDPIPVPQIEGGAQAMDRIDGFRVKRIMLCRGPS